MKIISGLSITVTTFCLYLAVGCTDCCARGTTDDVPRVRMEWPGDNAVIDLTGRAAMLFTWSADPAPAGGVNAYNITIYRKRDQQYIAEDELPGGTLSHNVPSDAFTGGETYIWYVQQQDAASGKWGTYDTRQINIIKED